MDITAVNLTPQAISKLLTGDINEMLHTRPVVQLIDINYRLVISDGSNSVKVYFSKEVIKLVSSKKVGKGSIVQLTNFSAGFPTKLWGRPITVKALNIIYTKCDIIGNPKPFYDDPMDKYRLSSDDYSVDDDDSADDYDSEPDQNEDFLAPTQKCSCSQNESNKKRKFESSEAIAKDISRISEMLIEKNKENDMGACFEKLQKIGWGTEDPMYDTAILLFGESVDYRKVWLHLKPESCGKWVKNAGSKFGLLG